MRLNDIKTLAIVDSLFNCLCSAALTRRALVAFDRLAPYRDRVVEEVRRCPRLAAGLQGANNIWTILVDSFCAMIDPCLSRLFPDVRLVAVATASRGIELHKISKGKLTELGALTEIDAAVRTEIAETKWTAIELRLPSDQLLHRTLSLPAAGREFLGPIIEHRLERLTPWSPDRVLYGFRVVEEPEAGGSVSVALTTTSKDFVAAPLRALNEIGLVPTAIGACETSWIEPLQVSLLRATEKVARIDSRQAFSRIALTAFGLLTLSYLGSSLWADNALEQQKDAGVKLMKARRLLKAASIGAIGEQEQALLDAKQPDKSVVVLIDKLAKAISQDTFLKELDVAPDKVRLAGISGNAPALIGSIERAGLTNVRLGGAVTREKDQRDSFEVTADRWPQKVERP